MKKEIRSRREFFKKAVNAALPIIAMAILPSALASCEGDDIEYSGGGGTGGGGTSSGCRRSSCASACRAKAKYSPYTCKGSCKTACQSCRSLCYGTAKTNL
ncbi:MAG: hypothetical protein K2F95_02300 [Alistipes sp.]|nr:hypothetical protein [Alistipes sp.]